MACDERRELEQAYKDLYNQIHGKNLGARRGSGMAVVSGHAQPPAIAPIVNFPLMEESQRGAAALSMSKNFWMHMP